MCAARPAWPLCPAQVLVRASAQGWESSGCCLGSGAAVSRVLGCGSGLLWGFWALSALGPGSESCMAATPQDLTAVWLQAGRRWL